MKIDENIANTDRELLHISWMTWGNSMIQWKFQEKSCKKPGFHPLFQIDPPLPPSCFRVKGHLVRLEKVSAEWNIPGYGQPDAGYLDQN